jgi:UDP:flavonoid glycosyltransferase YjiC (YdhE family)
MYRDVHGVGLPCPILDWTGHAEAVVQFTVPAFEYPRSDAPATLHFAGPLSATGSHAPRPDWWPDLDGGRPIVHVTQGTIANKDFTQLVQPALEALARDDVLVVVSTGGRPLDTLPPLPDNARAAEYLPYDELLPRTAVFVTNGGYGGVQYALRYGVPIVATGGKEDKPEVGGRVMWSGVGRRIRTDQPSRRALRRAIHDVLHEPRFRDASRRIAADMADAPGLDGLTAVIDDLAGDAVSDDDPRPALAS